MANKRLRFTPALSFAGETLESRLVMSAARFIQAAAEIAAQANRGAPTQTTLTVSAGTLGQPTTFTATVRAPASSGSPQGTVNIVDHGTVLQTLTLSPTYSTNGKYAYSEASYTLTPQPGGNAYFFGKHTVCAQYVPSGTALKSSTNKTFTVGQPAYTTLANGVKIATIVPGSGPQIQSGQTASVFYTGYLAKNGHIFDDSINDGGTPFTYTVGAGQVIPGFDAGTVGMQVGESRLVMIPAAEAYGRTGSGPIPPNSTLVFELTLLSIA